VDVNGRVGVNALDVRWDANLRSLAIVQRGMSGTLVSVAVRAGTPTKPIVGTAQLGQFAFEGTAVTKRRSRSRCRCGDRRRSHILLRAQDIVTPGVES
jgi:hypothetical protein